ncbi:hypothetical protein HDV05_000355, partial [Chytridiales sp. JEL 0842]
MNEELDPNAVRTEAVVGSAGSTILAQDGQNLETVIVKNAMFRWNKTSDEPILSDISFTATSNSLLSIVGMVGAGKSSLISGLLGEMYKSSGDVYIRGSIAFVPQTPWIMNATLRDNITFGKPFDLKYYEKTIAACGLKPDLEMLPGGDLTEIGERGITLSGGQKQRVSLARAVYARADIYLLDDTLSAVDAHVGRHIFDNVIGPKGLLASKTRIFVTHSIQFLPESDRVIMLQAGRIVESGSYKDLMALGSSGSLYSLMKEYGKRKNDSSEALNDTSGFDCNDPKNKQVAGVLENEKAMSRAHSKDSLPEKHKGEQDVESGKVTKGKPNNTLMTIEQSAKGSVKWSVYSAYAASCGTTSVIAYLIVAVISQFLSISQNLYLADWADSNDRHTERAIKGLLQSDEQKDDVFWRLAGYGSLGFLYSGSIIFQVIFVWVFCGIKSARALHKQMLENVIHLPQSYFDTTPMGRILNRFSKDVNVVDEVLPRVFQGYFRTLF